MPEMPGKLRSINTTSGDAFGITESGRNSVDGWTVACLGDGFSAGTARLQPCFLGDLDFAQRFLGRLAKGGARFQVRNISHIAAVFFAVKEVDVIVFHRLNRSRLIETPPPRAGTVESGRA